MKRIVKVELKEHGSIGMCEETYQCLAANGCVKPIEYNSEDFAFKGQQQTQMHHYLDQYAELSIGLLLEIVNAVS